MTKEIEYDFKSTKSTKETQEDVRPNLRIIRCCENCKFFKKRYARDTRGYCMYPNPTAKQPRKRLGESVDKEEMVRTWTHTYITCLCDLFQLRSKKYDIDLVSDWLDKKFLNDGTVKNE